MNVGRNLWNATVAVFLGMCLSVSCGKELVQESGFSDIAVSVARMLPEEHFSGGPLNDDVARRALLNYLEALDEFHVYFLASDIAELSHEQDTLDDRLGEGDIELAYRAYSLLKKRVADRCSYVDKLIDSEIDLTKKEGFAWERRFSPWPADKEAWDETWRKIVKNRYLQGVVSEALDREDGNSESEPEVDADESDRAIRKAVADRYRRYLDLLDKRDAETIMELYLSSFALAYDPHCQYMAPSTVDDFDVAMKLSLVGIGAVLRPEEGAALVVRIVPGGPAASDKRDLRLREGDRIIAVAEGDEPPVDTLHWPLNRVVHRIRGEKGTKVVLTVIPASDPTGGTTKTIDLIRDEIKLEGQAARHETREVTSDSRDSVSLGVITLPSFYGDIQAAMDGVEDATSATRDVARCVEGLKTNDVKGIIVDLRNNGGGALREAAMMTGLFIEQGPVVQVVSREGISVLPDTDPSVAYKGPLVVLVNRNSASASEIFAGALQDYGRAVVVGDSKTLGKGSVQAVKSLSDDKRMGSLRVTTALYYRVLGSSTQLKGVSSDIVLSSPLDRLKVGEDYLRNPLEWSMVRPLLIRPYADLADALTVIGDKSYARQAESERYGAYVELLDQVEAMDNMHELPLDLERRMTLERKRRDVRKAAFGEDESSKNRPDVVLSEALKVLVDLVKVFSR